MVGLAAAGQAQNMRPAGQPAAMPTQAQGNAYGRMGMRPPQAPVTQMGQGVTPRPMGQSMMGMPQQAMRPAMPQPAMMGQAPSPSGFGQQVAGAAQQLGGTMGGDRDRVAQQQFLSMLRAGR